MLYNAKNGVLRLDGDSMAYIAFGSGKRDLIMIPGVGDGLKTVRGTALPFAMAYRAFAGEFRVWVFSRRNHLEPGCSTRDMAADLSRGMETLGISRADIVGVSQGGMIAQHLSIDCPERIGRLVLAVTSARPNATLEATLGGWLELARAGDRKGLLIASAERSYSESYLKRYRRLYPLLEVLAGRGELDRFIIQAQSCLRHDAYAALGKIVCPTLVLGGEEDRVLGAEASQELAAAIPGSRLHMYAGLGHGAYEEAKDFPARVREFLRAEN